jgi:hypothetical protein
VLFASLVTACSTTSGGGGASSTTSPTPEATALAWFHDINTDNVAAARRLFSPGEVQMITWMNGPASAQSTFSGVHCQTLSTSSSNAAVNCTFKESVSPTEGNPDSFWNLSMVKSSDSRWLIDNYGQG